MRILQRIILTLLGWFLVFSPMFVSGQVNAETEKKYNMQFGVYYQPNLANRYYLKKDVKPVRVLNNPQKLSHTTGITWNISLSNHVALRLGIGFTDKGYAFETRDIAGPYSDEMVTLRVTLSYYYLAGSLGIQYYIIDISNRVRLFSSALYYPNYYVSNRKSVRYLFLEEKTKFISFNSETGFKPVAHNGSISAGLEYQISNRWIAVTEPTYNFPLGPFKTDRTYYPYSFGLRFEMCYKF